jgi:hypothetical protein
MGICASEEIVLSLVVEKGGNAQSLNRYIKAQAVHVSSNQAPHPHYNQEPHHYYTQGRHHHNPNQPKCLSSGFITLTHAPSPIRRSVRRLQTMCVLSSDLYFVLSPVLTDKGERHISSTPNLKMKLATLLYSKGSNSFL